MSRGPAFGRSLAVLILIVVAAAIVAGPEICGVLRVFTQPRDGCTFAEAAAGGWNLVETLLHNDVFFLTSRIIERDPAGYVLWRTAGGDYWAPAGDYSLFYVLAELELEPYDEGRRDLLQGKTVLDCGAHLGVFTRQALEAGAARVIAIEPGPQQVYCLRRTFAREIAAGRVTVEAKGVWDQEGQLELAAGPDTARWSFTGLATGKTVTAPVTTIDRLARDLSLGPVGFIKMDIEGAEPRALAGASRVLSDDRPALAIAAYHRPDDQREIRAAVRKANPAYRVFQTGCRVDLGVSVPLTLMFE
ncbi:MAG: FkbM family methyltransferase [Bryobacterales bacterium]|nr:FkbM family methyltransferase [Bryobacterales bacterium]